MRSGTSAVPCHPDNGSQRQARTGRPSLVGPDRPAASRAGPLPAPRIAYHTESAENPSTGKQCTTVT